MAGSDAIPALSPCSDLSKVDGRRFLRLRTLAPLLGVLAFAFALRVYGANFGLPSLYQSDEIFVVQHALKFGLGDLNPHWFLYPSLSMYVLFVEYGLFYLSGLLAGAFSVPWDLAVLYFTDPTALYLIARITAALLGTATVLLAYLLGKELFSPRVGLVSAAFLAVLPIPVEESHYGTTDIPMGFLTASTLLTAALLLKTGSLRWYLLTGLLAGLAGSAKYPGGLFVVALLLAHTLRPAPRPWAPFVVGLALAPAGFLLGTPFALLDLSTFWAFVVGQAEQARAGWLGTVAWTPYVDVLRSILPAAMTWLFTIAALLATGYALLRRSPQDILLLGVFGAFFLVLGASALNWPRYWIPILPILSILVARLVVETGGLLADQLLPWLIWRRAIALLLALALLVPPALASLHVAQGFTQLDNRTLAAEWIVANIPPGTKMAIAQTGPQLSQTRDALREQLRLEMLEDAQVRESEAYKTTPRESRETKEAYYDLRLRIPPREPSYHAVYLSSPAVLPLSDYVENGYSYVVIDEWSRRSYLLQRGRFPGAAAFYEQLERGHMEAARFADYGGPQILVYRLAHP
ncbi:MAG: glycosyltransferase family 39 protein [Chloroflexi bacterium]|nr:glycosyltransferase family 39 protein [Chloroflexota bacterium]